MTRTATTPTVADAALPHRSAVRRSDHIAEIDGLRGVAIALVVVYHVWLNRVSGGIDVFLLLSGFLITWTLVRSLERHGRVRFLAFYARVVRRIFPPAMVVLVGVVLATVLWLPQTRWREILADVLGSAVYLVNWHLAGNAVDYLAARDAASPVQHYWSLAIQGQFYLAWPVVVTAGALLAGRLSVPVRPVLAVLLGGGLLASLGYSVHRTVIDPVFTYFDTFARVWELALGGLLLLGMPLLRLPRPVRVLLGWAGLVALASCGLVFRAGNEFPGWAALWPTLAGALTIVAAGSGSAGGADRLLRSGPVRWLGGQAYSLYLWHWPVLICYLSMTDRAAASLGGGLLVIGCSVPLAVATTWLLAGRPRRSGPGQRGTAGGFALGAAGVAAVLATTGVWQVCMQWQRPPEPDPRDYPGAAHLVAGGPLPDVPYLPSALDAGEDRAAVYDSGCHQNQRDSEARMCEFGPAGAERTIALVGGSHSAHWLPALQELTGPYRWRVVSITKSSCRFEHPSDRADSCRAWNGNVLAAVAGLRPDAVLTTSTSGQGGDNTPEGYLTQWRRLEELGIRVLAVRDTPWHDFDVPECVAINGRDAAACGGSRASHGLDRPAVEARADLPGNVRFLDLTDLVCEAEHCPAVVGNVLVYHDAHHLSATYSRTLAPFLGEAIMDATGWRPPG